MQITSSGTVLDLALDCQVFNPHGAEPRCANEPWPRGGPVRCEASRSASPRRELLLGSLSQNRHAAADLKEDHPLIIRQPNVGGTHLDPPATVEISNLSKSVRNIGTKSHANDRARTENGRCGLLSTSTS
jgi:hypothetical protein